MGFGHRVYKNYDPRAKIIKKMADEVFEVTGRNPLLDIALELERIALAGRLLRQAQALPERRLLLGPHLPGDGLPGRHVPGAVRHPAHGRLARAVGGDARGPGAEDRAAAADLLGLRPSATTSRSTAAPSMAGTTTAGTGPLPVPAVLLSAEASGRSVLLEHEVYAPAGLGRNRSAALQAARDARRGRRGGVRRRRGGRRRREDRFARPAAQERRRRRARLPQRARGRARRCRSRPGRRADGRPGGPSRGRARRRARALPRRHRPRGAGPSATTPRSGPWWCSAWAASTRRRCSERSGPRRRARCSRPRPDGPRRARALRGTLVHAASRAGCARAAATGCPRRRLGELAVALGRLAGDVVRFRAARRRGARRARGEPVRRRR